MTEIAESIRKGILDLLNLSSRRLFAVGSAGLLAVLGLSIAAHLDPITFGSGVQFLSAALLAFALFALTLAVFQLYAERHSRTFTFAPFGHECWAHVTTQRDGRVTTQIVCDLHVFNLTDESRWLSDIKLVRPRTHGRVLSHMVMVQQQNGHYYGPYEIPPRGNTDARGHMIIEADLDSAIGKRGIVLRISDQDGHWHILKFPNARVHSRAVVPPAGATSQEEVGVSVEPAG
jgi:hypothetical protein